MAVYSKLFYGAFNRFKLLYNKHLLLSNTLSTMVLLAAGDLITQFVEIKLKERYSAAAAANNQQRLSSTTKNNDNNNNNNNKIMTNPRNNYSYSFYDNYDWNRSAKLATIGLLAGPFGHYWYTFLDRRFKSKSVRSVISKILCDQLIAAPIFNVLFIYGTHALDGKHIAMITEIFKEKFLTIYSYDCAIWPAAQLVNFLLVPAIYRLLYVNVVSLVWNAILSYILFSEVDDDNE